VLVKKDRYGDEFMAYGGDFDDRPTDYNFCGNGIVYGDRRESPKMQEVKFLYQNIKLLPDQSGVKIVNENLFAGTDEYWLEYALYRDGYEVARHSVEIDVAAQSEAYVPFAMLDF